MPRYFCCTCLKYFLDPKSQEDYSKIIQHPWSCCLCNPASQNESMVKIRHNWEQRFLSAYKKNFPIRHLEAVENNNVKTKEKPSRKTKLRVLSLFDGISTGTYGEVFFS